MTPSQRAVLSRLDRHGPVSPSELAAAEHVRPQSMTAIVSALEELAFITRVPDPDDGRRLVVHMTDSGAASLLDHRKIREEWLIDELNEKYNVEERKTILKALDLMARLAEA